MAEAVEISTLKRRSALDMVCACPQRKEYVRAVSAACASYVQEAAFRGLQRIAAFASRAVTCDTVRIKPKRYLRMACCRVPSSVGQRLRCMRHPSCIHAYAVLSNMAPFNCAQQTRGSNQCDTCGAHHVSSSFCMWHGLPYTTSPEAVRCDIVLLPPPPHSLVSVAAGPAHCPPTLMAH